MAEQALYDAGGVVVTPRLAKINGQTFAINQISSVEMLARDLGLARRVVRSVTIFAVVLLSTGYAALYLARNDVLGRSMETTLVGISVLGLLLGGLFALIAFAMAIIAWASKGTVPQDALQIGTSDGRSVEIAVPSRVAGEAIKDAIERAIAGTA